MNDWLTKILDDLQVRRMGHSQRRPDLNRGLGWLYYGLALALQSALWRTSEARNRARSR